MNPHRAQRSTPLDSDTPLALPVTELLEWFERNERDLPWRRPGTTAWGVLVSEVMSQQTPVARVAPQWQQWMQRWPTPADLAQASSADVLRAWDRLGYPRRALRLRDCAQRISQDFDGVVPADLATLLTLPGIGSYTAAAVACFAYGQNVPVIDTNVRRVIARLLDGTWLSPAPSARELPQLAALLPDHNGPRLSAALMELGALVCTARSPQCQDCPVLDHCAWQRAGRPQPSAAESARAQAQVQKFAGTDRQVRGKIMAALRAADAPVAVTAASIGWADDEQFQRACASLIQDGLAVRHQDGRLELPLS